MEIGRRWRNNNRERFRETMRFAQQRRRAAHYKAGPFALTIEEWHMIKAHFDYRCQYCLKQFPSKLLTMDHIIPVSKGGPTIMSNIVPACRSCNGRKHTGAPPIPVQPLLL